MAATELEKLLTGEAAHVFAILDGASISDLPRVLYEKQPPNYCLMRGKVGPDMATVAPYVIGLIPGSPFTQWLLDEPVGKHYGVFATSRQSMNAMRKHFRDLFLVHDEAGVPMHFRFYDPRVMHAFLPTCNAGELRKFFGPIDKYVAEHEDGSGYSAFSIENNELAQSVIKLGKGSSEKVLVS